jgi:two-component system, response regulator PdtaR
MARGPLDVLIVEERPFDGMDLEEAVLLAGHQVIGWATTLRNAMALVEARRADLAFVGQRLRDGDTGIELSRRLSECGIPVVITTAHPDQVGSLEHVLGVLPKPFALETVQQVIDYAVQKAEGSDAEPNTVTQPPLKSNE